MESQLTDDVAEYRMVGGNHYKVTELQPWDVIDGWSHEDQDGFEAYLWGNALKYLQRYRRKGMPAQDIGKAIHYLQRLEEVLTCVYLDTD